MAAHALEPDADVVPTGHAAHALEPAFAANVPTDRNHTRRRRVRARAPGIDRSLLLIPECPKSSSYLCATRTVLERS
jgi:hypothetical protein